MVHSSRLALRFRKFALTWGVAAQKVVSAVPPPIIIVTGYKVSWGPFNSLVFGPSFSSSGDKSGRVNHSAEKVRPKWPKQQELIKFKIHPTQFEVLSWLTCPGDQVMPYKSHSFRLEREAEMKPDSSLMWHPKLLLKRHFNSYGTMLKWRDWRWVSDCYLLYISGAHLSNIHTIIFRTEITVHCSMKGRYSTQFHLWGKECSQLPYCTLFHPGLRGLRQAQDDPDWYALALDWPLT